MHWYWSLPLRFALSAAVIETPQAAPMESMGIRGVNLGGLFVLEPWLTPSLFFQFEGRPPNQTAVDSYTFCQALGHAEANRQLRRLWDSWVTEQDIASLKALGLNTVRIPVGDYMFRAYGPYVGCFDGSIDALDRVLQWCSAHSLKVLLDLHVVKGNANGFDNGGLSSDLFWDPEGGSYTKALAPRWLFGDYTTHLNEKGEAMYSRRVGLGNYEKPSSTLEYNVSEINWANFNMTVAVLKDIIARFNESMWGLQVVNEPSWLTPWPVLQLVYEIAERELRAVAPDLVIFFHDKFRFTDDNWDTNPVPGTNSVLDTHIYLAWEQPVVNRKLFKNVCAWKKHFAARRENGTRVVVGEWSIATDTCALFLTGYNFALPEIVYTCQKNPKGCPSNYSEQGVIPRVPNVATVGGGLGPSVDGDCPIGAKSHHKEAEQFLGRLLFETYASGDGFFFWNFKTENEDPRWDYRAAVAAGLLPSNASAPIEDACDSIDQHCAANPALDCDNYIAAFSPTYHPSGGSGGGESGSGDWSREVVVMMIGVAIVIVLVAFFLIYRMRKSHASNRELLLQGYQINGPNAAVL